MKAQVRITDQYVWTRRIKALIKLYSCIVAYAFYLFRVSIYYSGRDALVDKRPTVERELRSGERYHWSADPGTKHRL